MSEAFDLEKRADELLRVSDGRWIEWAPVGYRKRAIQLARDAADAEREKWQEAESALSAAYLRLRRMIPGALKTGAHALYGPDLWGHVEDWKP